MSIISWFNKILGIDNSRNNFGLPSEFQVPSEHMDHMNDGTHNFENNNFIDPFDRNNIFEESMNIFHSSLQDMLEQFELQFPSNFENNDNSNVFIVPFNEEDGFINQSSNAVEYNKIPKQNFITKNYFLNSSQASNTLDRTPVRVTMSPGINFGQSSSRTYVSGKWNGRTIEKETCTKQLQGGITEKVIVMKDGNQKCVTTVTENSRTGEQNSNKQLFNLDESQLNEFENRFAKFR